MKAQELFRAGDLSACLLEHKKFVASNPVDLPGRMFLFQLFCYTCEWDRALAQLDVIEKIDKNERVFARIYRSLINVEKVRLSVAHGEATPLFMGKPGSWVASMIEANKFLAAGNESVSTNLRENAFAEAATVPGLIGGESFEWLSDQDVRYGPILELFTQGKYYWCAMSDILNIRVSPPQTYLDLLYPTATLNLITGGQLDVFLFARYPVDDLVADDAILLNRKTSWSGEDFSLTGSGQRMLCSDQSDFPLLNLPEVVFTQE